MENENLKTVLDLGRATGDAKTTEPLHYAVIPTGSQIVSLERYQYGNAPIRVRATVTLHDADSLIRYWKMFSDPDSQMFFNKADETFTAYIDYHTHEDAAATTTEARFGEHVAMMALEKSPQFAAWSGSNNKQMDQTSFAIFLEDRAKDVTEPSAAEMLEAARSLKAKKDVDFSSEISLASGQVRFRYNETIQGRVGGGELEIFEKFTIVVPVYRGGATFDIPIRLRWRVTAEKHLVFWYTIIGLQELLNEAIDAQRAKVDAGTGTPSLGGVVTSFNESSES